MSKNSSSPLFEFFVSWFTMNIRLNLVILCFLCAFVFSVFVSYLVITSLKGSLDLIHTLESESMSMGSECHLHSHLRYN